MAWKVLTSSLVVVCRLKGQSCYQCGIVLQLNGSGDCHCRRKTLKWDDNLKHNDVTVQHYFVLLGHTSVMIVSLVFIHWKPNNKKKNWSKYNLLIYKTNQTKNTVGVVKMPWGALPSCASAWHWMIYASITLCSRSWPFSGGVMRRGMWTSWDKTMCRQQTYFIDDQIIHNRHITFYNQMTNNAKGH